MDPIITAYNYILSWDYSSSPQLLHAIHTIIRSDNELHTEPLQNVLLAISEETLEKLGQQSKSIEVLGGKEPLLTVDAHGRAIVGTLPKLKLVQLD